MEAPRMRSFTAKGACVDVRSIVTTACPSAKYPFDSWIIFPHSTCCCRQVLYGHCLQQYVLPFREQTLHSELWNGLRRLTPLDLSAI
ncbi:MAG: hypothetical protein OEY99_02150 [Aigarchaeota archaeon]|nr:hypothetical protein [Aigarchaeota archaeon]